MKKLLTGLLVGVAAIGVSAFFLLKDGGPEGGGEKFEGILRVGVECDFPPYNWEENKPSETNLPLVNNKGFYAEGYDLQMAKLITQQLGAKLEVHKVAWGDLLPALKGGKIDMIMSGMADTAERKAIPEISASPTYNPNVAEYSIMVRKDSRFVEAAMLADFYGARVVGQKGTRLDAVIDQIPGVQHLPPSDTISQMFEYLEKNIADAVVINTESIQAYLKEYPQLAYVRFSHNQGFKLDFTGICVWTRREDKTLSSAVKTALDKIPFETREKLLEYASHKGDDR